ncbi:IS200/IS605 family transposase [Vibrio coralliilyticus]|nr:IS200/IS605 family transposase [Vibrio coralliilyticus]
MPLHVICIIQYRRKVFGELHLRRLETTFKELCEGFEAKLNEFNGEPDHVHLLISVSPKTPSVVNGVNSLSATSSRRLRRKSPCRQRWYDQHFDEAPIVLMVDVGNRGLIH